MCQFVETFLRVFATSASSLPGGSAWVVLRCRLPDLRVEKQE